MNIIFPIGGKGERFKKEGYSLPKPLIPVFDKCIFFHVLDNLSFSKDDIVFIIHHESLDEFNFNKVIKERYCNLNVYFIKLSCWTSGASETLKKGCEAIELILRDMDKKDNRVTVCLDCDNFYTTDILTQIRTLSDCFSSGVINTNNSDENPVYSYVRKNDETVIEIVEKVKISDVINTGCYFYKNLETLKIYVDKVCDEMRNSKKECYQSEIIKRMLQDNKRVISVMIDSDTYFNLGTPVQLQAYIDKTHAFLFDLDGTLVLTDDIYFQVWKHILESYNIVIDEVFYYKYIFGNTDLQVLQTVLFNIDLSVEELSYQKDDLFLKNLDKIRLANGVIRFFENIKKFAHKIGIVTNCNRKTAVKILNYFSLEKYIDCLVIASECEKPKPFPHPYLQACKQLNISNDKVIIFEDSKGGLLSAKNMFPKRVYAIQTLYNKEEYKKLGVYETIQDFGEMSVQNALSNLDSNYYQTWLKNVIQSSIDNKDVFLQNEMIKDIIIDQAKLKGGYISDVLSIDIVTELNVYSVVLKLENPNDSFLSKMAHRLGLYEREYYFYEKISSLVPCLVPKFYGTVYNEKSQKIGILLENQYKLGLCPSLNLNNEHIENSLNVVSEIAKLHAKFWNKDLCLLFPELKRHNDDLFKPAWSNFLKDKWELFQEKWIFTLKPHHKQIIKNAIQHFDNIQDYLSEKNLTLCHGDLKSPNMFFQKDNTIKKLYSPCFIDWQYANNGKGVQDIVFFIIESFDIDKIQKFQILLREYYYVKCLELGIKYDRTDYDKDFLYSIFYFPLFVCVWFGTLDTEDLIDKNFPYFFIQKFLHLVDLYKDQIEELQREWCL
jgi:HAD superfamily hydrolase (TIGR01509 family)